MQGLQIAEPRTHKTTNADEVRVGIGAPAYLTVVRGISRDIPFCPWVSWLRDDCRSLALSSDFGSKIELFVFDSGYLEECVALGQPLLY